MGLETTIRLAQLGDIDAIKAIELDAGEMFRTIGLDAIADAPLPPDTHFAGHIEADSAWVAERNDEPVGFLLASIVDDAGHIDQVSVRRSAAGNKVGAALVRTVCEWTAALGHGSVTLTTFVDVEWNGPYYRRLGFVSIDAADLGPQLRAILDAERADGIEIISRTAMRLAL